MNEYRIHYFPGDDMTHSSSMVVRAEEDPPQAGLWKVERQDGSTMWINTKSPRLINVWDLRESEVFVAG